MTHHLHQYLAIVGMDQATARPGFEPLRPPPWKPGRLLQCRRVLLQHGQALLNRLALLAPLAAASMERGIVDVGRRLVSPLRQRV